jgi:hypothetical protein
MRGEYMAQPRGRNSDSILVVFVGDGEILVTVPHFSQLSQSPQGAVDGMGGMRNRSSMLSQKRIPVLRKML